MMDPFTLNQSYIKDTNRKTIPLSAYQRREWILWGMAGRNNPQFVSVARKLNGVIDKNTLEKRLNKAIKSHPALQLVIDPDKPTASIVPEENNAIITRYVNLEEDLSKAVIRISLEISRDPFLISSMTTPIRTILVRNDFGDKKECALLFVTHPIIADETSIEQLLQEIAAEDAAEGNNDVFIHWAERNNEWGEGKNYKQKIVRYRQLLDGTSFQIDLPTDRTRPPLICNEGGYVKVDIPGPIQKRVTTLAKEANCGTDAVVIAALGGYFTRLTRQEDFTFGIKIDLRDPNLMGSIGPFNNTAVLRVQIPEESTGLQTVNSVRQGLDEINKLRDLPFEFLIDALQIERDPSRTPVFQVFFAYHLREDDDNWMYAPTGRVSADLDIILEQRTDNYSIRLGYRNDIFSHDTAKNLGEHLIELIDCMCKQPHAPIKTLDICKSNERAWILSAFGVQNHFHSDATIHSLVTSAASRDPEATAVCFENERISYGELNQKANQLAHRLRSNGVGPDDPVAVCMERSVELIVTLLAVLKAGGAYVPIEPANPRGRIEFVLADSKARLLVTDVSLSQRFENAAIDTMVVDPGGAAFADEPVTDPEEKAAPHNLAYVIYTSGSTGRPKGVLIEHRNVVRLFEATHEWFHFGEADVWTMFHSVAFDFSVWEIWGALIHGARLVVVPYLTSRSPRDFYHLLAREKVTVLNQTPSAFRQLIWVEEEGDHQNLSLRLVIFGGEALEFESLRPWFERHGDRFPQLINMYGITETCVHVTYRKVSMADLDGGVGSSAIGIPLPDLSSYVVDENLQLLPPGVPGELVVGGAGLARGYLDRPELTAERFIPDPFSKEADARLYRSGDLVRLLPTGELDYLGRIDQQVQIRGFRIETAEIEAVMRRSGLVKDVAVIPWKKKESEETTLVGYVVSSRSSEALREAARESLPEYMVPNHFVAVSEIPMTTNGKLDRKALPEPRIAEKRSSRQFVAPAGEFEQIIAEIWCDVLGVDSVGTHDRFFDVGGTSLGLVRIASRLRKRLECEISVAALFQYPTITMLANHLGKRQLPAEGAGTKAADMGIAHMENEPIAVIGMAGRFQGADTIEALWDLLERAGEAITFFNYDELDSSIDPALVSDADYVKARGVLSGADQFDAAFFGMTPSEVEVTDPQQRVLMEVAWEALEYAGIDPTVFPGLIATYAGVYNNTYYTENLLKRPDILDKVGPFQAMVGNEKDFVATRIAHRLNLNGPAISIHTACSTSLVAVVQAFYALRTRQCDLALAGAAAVTCPQKSGYLYQDGGMLSIDGHTRPFDELATGTVFSDGAAMVVLRRLSDARDAGDSIYAVIRGAATNNDGGQRMSFSAPTVKWQADVIERALSVANVNPETIDYVEAHGTATPLGDPIEVAALKQAFEKWTQKRGFCALGSIKSNIGHVTAPAGVAGLIKTALAFNRERIPKSLGFSRPNPEINFDDSPFFVAAEAIHWPKNPNKPRRACVSSFGVGGTNAHVVLEEPPTLPQGGKSRALQLLVFSAKNETALDKTIENVAAHLQKSDDTDLADVAFTLQNGRAAFSHRAAVVVANTVETISRLYSRESNKIAMGKTMPNKPSVVFLFPGQGSQYRDMGRQLYNSEAVFRSEVDQCSEILKAHLGLDLRAVLYSEPENPKTADQEVDQTWLAQPAIFVVEYALARLWMHWGVEPAAMIGHSIGEYVAAVLAGTFSLEQALGLLSERARLMQALPPGAMLSVRMNADKLKDLIPPGTSIAAINSPFLSVVSGSVESIEALNQQLDLQNIASRRLHTSHAFHSAMLDPMLEEFARAARQTPGQTPSLDWVSTCTGNRIRPDELADGSYWVRQVRQPVRFGEAVTRLIDEAHSIFLEVGPGQTLCQLIRQNGSQKAVKLAVVPSLGPVGEPDKDLSALLGAAGDLWIRGVDIDWKRFSEQEKRRRIALPTYPFERKRYWVDPFRKEIINNPAIKSESSADMRIENTIEQEIQSEPVINEVDQTTRKERIINELRELFQQYSGDDYSAADPNESFMDIGFDSLLITQASLGVKKRFGLKVTFRQMVDGLSTFEKLAGFLDEKLPSDAFAPPAKVQANPAVETILSPQRNALQSNSLPPTREGLLESVIQKQMAIMTEQLNLLRQAAAGGHGLSSSTPTYGANRTRANSKEPVVTAVNLETQSHFGPFKAIDKGPAGDLTERQKEVLDRLVDRYNRKTAKSKALSQQHRRHFCDPRAAGNFRQLWKEMVYPIACARSKGSHIWDIDGNEYIDVTMGFGTNYLGHSPDFVVEAIAEQMNRGMEIGPQSPIAGEVARMICELTGMDRATFCNTGSEAVMASFRVARTVTGREKIVYFFGDYHGIFDEVLGRPAMCDGIPGAMPIAPGIPHLANVMILEYGKPSSLETIRRFADDIAAVIVEPVQSRHPALQPREFLHALRQLTREHDIALIFDEVITGFRVALGGAQEFFDVKADMATYGKVVGGGMPIGVLAGSATYMDALDGGFWQYGDDSSPPTGVTFFAGTFVRHPLAMAAAHASLSYLKASGPALQHQVNERTARFVQRVNHFFTEQQLPMKFQTVSAIFYYDFHPDLKFAGLLFYYLRDRGIHIWEGRVGCISIAHTDQDLDRVLVVIQESIAEMQAGGLLPEPASASATGPDVERYPAGDENGEGRSADKTISSHADRFPLAKNQFEMWIGAQMGEKAAGPHHACTGLYLDGKIDISALQRAIVSVVQRHEGLKCTFSEDGNDVIVHPSFTPDIRLHDFSELEKSRQDERVDELLHQEGRRLLDLTHGPLVEFQIVKLSDQRHLLFFSAQMIVCDGWSHYVVFEDMGAAYSAYASGNEPILAPPVPMRAFAQWEQENADADEAKESKAFWLAQFRDLPPVLNLPTSRPRPPVRTFDASRCTLTLGAELCRDIRRIAREQKNSYFALLLAAYQVWLHRLTGCRDLVVGVPFAAQGPLGLDRLVGQCANILPLRSIIDPEAPFAELLSQTWSRILDAQENWNITFGQLASKLDLPHDPSRIPLVPVLFNIDPAMSKVGFKGLTHRFVTGPRYYYQYDIGFNLVEDEETILVECDYNSNLFDGEVVRAWTAGYETLLVGIVQDVNQAVGRLTLTEAPVKGQWVFSGSEKLERQTKGESSLNGLVATQAALTPDAIAIESNGSQLSYGELEHQAGMLSVQLREHGVGSGKLVGVCLPRSLELPVALLGVLKAGAAYLAIDPAMSVDQMSAVIAGSDMTLLVVDVSTTVGFTSTIVQRIAIEDMMAGVGDPAVVSSPAATKLVSGDEIAYAITTAGSTGEPKTVEISHGAIIHLLQALRNQPGFDGQDVMLAASPLSFFASALELWLPLSVGARAVIVPCTTAIDPNALSASIQQHGITVMQATPSAWQRLIQEGWPGCSHLRAWSGGEALWSKLAEDLLPRCIELWNLYGSAETTGWTFASRVQTGERVTLGGTIAGTSARIVDDQLHPVPVGVPGELVIAADGLACGYRGHSGTKTRRFINGLSIQDQNTRIFRTGDLARHTADGQIEFLGRKDSQVEIRGFRFELGEIETVLTQIEGIRQAVVKVYADTEGNPVLVGYAVSEEDAQDAEHILDSLREHLPEYMVPAQLVFLKTFPLSPTHTLDHRQLPVPDLQPHAPGTRQRSRKVVFVAPRTSTEKVLAEIWNQVLNIKKPGIHDNFFELGGQSMLAMKAVLLAGKMGLALKPRSIFLHPTIARLAAAADQNVTGLSVKDESTVSPTGSVPLTPAQIRFLQERETCNPHHWNFSVLLQAHRLNPKIIEVALKGLLTHHDALRLRLSIENSEWHQYIDEVTDDVAFTSHDLSGMDPKARSAHIEATCEELQSSLNITHGPMLRVVHFGCGPNQSDRLFFTMHHLIMDVYSWDVFWEDFETAYQSGLNGGAVTFQPKTTSFRDWSLRLRELAASTEVQAAIPQWVGLPWDQVGRLPLDFTATPGANTNASTDDYELLISASEASPILTPGGDSRPEEVMLAALAQTLGEWTSAPVVVIDCLNHGRLIVGDADLSRTVGFMLCYQTVVLRTGETSDPAGIHRSTIDQIRQLPEAFTFDLLRLFSEDQDVKHTFAQFPRAEVLFNFLGHQEDGAREGTSAFSPCDDACGSDYDPRNGRYYPLAISAAINGKRLRFRFAYSRSMHQYSSIEQLAINFRRILLDIASARSTKKCLRVSQGEAELVVKKAVAR